MGLAPLFIISLVFFATFILVATIIPLLDERRSMKNRIRDRMKGMGFDMDERPDLETIIREKYLLKLKPWERRLEAILQTEKLGIIIQQSGRDVRGYTLALISLACAVSGFFLISFVTAILPLKLMFALVCSLLPFSKLLLERRKRLDRIEEQLPEALDMIINSLRVGHSFVESIRIVSEGMKEPIASEFGMTHAEINYSNNIRRSLMNMLERVPGDAMLLVVISVLVQRETGGNITELMGHISKMIRNRFRFERRINTVSADGRLSGVVLSLLPVAVFGVIYFVNPHYISYLTNTATGRNLLLMAFGFIVLAYLWIQKLQKIKI